MKFDKIEIHQWQQFEAVEINFHKPLTVITGANGSGKTTLLNLLARHSGWQMTSLAVPKKMGVAGLWTFFKRFFKGDDKSHDNAIGSLKYDNGVSTKLAIPAGSE